MDARSLPLALYVACANPDPGASDTGTALDSAAPAADPGNGDVILVTWEGAQIDLSSTLRGPAGEVFALGLFPGERLEVVNPADCLAGLLGCTTAWPGEGEQVSGDVSDLERYTTMHVLESPKLDMGDQIALGGRVLRPGTSWGVQDLWLGVETWPVWTAGEWAGLSLPEDSAFGAYDGEADLTLPTPLSLRTPDPALALDATSDAVLPLTWDPADDGDLCLFVLWGVRLDLHAYDYAWNMTCVADTGAYDLDLGLLDIPALLEANDADEGVLELAVFRQATATATVTGHPVRLAARSEVWLSGTVSLPARRP